MSTNFYIRETSRVIESGKRVQEDQHIGKRSGGWVFHFNGENSKTVANWRNFIEMMTPNMQIVDEYDRAYSPEEFWEAVEQTKKPWGPNKIKPRIVRGKTGLDWTDEGFSFYAGEFC